MPVRIKQTATQVLVAGSSSTALSITINGTVTGNCLAAVAGIHDNNDTSFTVSTADGGNTWTTRECTMSSATLVISAHGVVAHAENITGGNRTITFTLTGASAGTFRYYILGCYELENVPSTISGAELFQASNNQILINPVSPFDGPFAFVPGITIPQQGFGSPILIGVALGPQLDGAAEFESPPGWVNSYRCDDAGIGCVTDIAHYFPGGPVVGYTARWKHDTSNVNEIFAAVVVAIGSLASSSAVPETRPPFLPGEDDGMFADVRILTWF